MPKNSRLFPLIHRTSLPLVAISSLPASGLICAPLMGPMMRRQNRAGQESIRTWILTGPSFTSIDQGPAQMLLMILCRLFTPSLHLAEFNANLLMNAFLCIETPDRPNAVFCNANLKAAISFGIGPDQR